MRLLLPLLGAVGALAVSSPTGPDASDPTTSALATASTSSTSPTRLLDCTWTVTVLKWPTFTNGPTLTVWAGNPTTSTETATVTSLADCRNCAHVTAITKSRGGHGPVVHHTTTVTSQVPADPITTTRTEVVYACKESQPNEPLAATQSPIRVAGMPAQVY